ncbi:MAG: 2-amino-4-hydroxy-6-hydroxymethyldihydropteridine diphosphokinase [Gammaproteobacteria bacterium]|nr:MAG: 2-amino-4-hydroxy-6-hydroxymethyldihydropteridine diphosphokinase [Gammaproteobacteria bacterium]
MGLGSNLGDPVRQLVQAQAALAARDDLDLVRCSSLYRTPPMGPPGQPEYVNAVAMLRTHLAPEALLDRLQAIERRQGRVRSGPRWGPRTLDLDVLLYGRHRIHTPRLEVPHPGIASRAFVLVPLAELAPELDVPGLGRVSVLLARVDTSGIVRISP